MEDILNQILSEMQKVNTRFDGLENGQKELKNEVQELKKEVQALKQSQEEIKAEVLKNGEKLDHLATEMRSHFRHLESKLDQHQKVFGEEHRIQRCVRQGIVSKEH